MMPWILFVSVAICLFGVVAMILSVSPPWRTIWSAVAGSSLAVMAIHFILQQW
jgi:hypothetical protein